MKPPVQQQSIWHCVEVKKWEHTVLPYGRKNPLPFPFSQRSHVGNLRQTKKQRETGVKRVETAGVYPLAHAAGRGDVPTVHRRRNPPLDTSEKPPAR